MIAPSGGFCPVGSSFGHGMSELVFQRTRHAVVGLKSIVVRRLTVNLPQRRDVVEDPEPAPVRRRDEIVVLDDDVPHGRRRHVQPQRLPVSAVVERDIDRALGGGEQQALLLRILTNGVDGLAVGNPGDDLRPRLAPRRAS